MAEIDPARVKERFEEVRDRIDRIERPWTHEVAIVAVTKGFGPDAIVAAGHAGARSIGENYAQELIGKAPVLDTLPQRPDVHFIGRLQSNKVRLLAGLVDVWASVDRSSLIDEIAKRAPGSAVLIQVNATGEEGKGGCALDEVAPLIELARKAELDVSGLMTVGPTGAPAAAAKPAFEAVRSLVDQHGLAVCSMGMSGDLDVAIAAGSTEVRVGTALFGSRS